MACRSPQTISGLLTTFRYQREGLNHGARNPIRHQRDRPQRKRFQRQRTIAISRDAHRDRENDLRFTNVSKTLLKRLGVSNGFPVSYLNTEA